MAKISQREARRLRKRVAELQGVLNSERRVWGPAFIGGADIGRAQWAAGAAIPVAVRTARKLGHAVIATAADDNGLVRFHALPLAEIA